MLGVADGSEMRAYVARPAAPARQGVLVFQEAFGVNAHIRRVAQRLAAEGYVALAPELYHRTAAPGFEARYEDFSTAMPHYKAMTPAGEAQDIAAAHAWLRQAGAERVVAVGFCMGGRVAVRSAATVPLAAAASFYGGNLASLTELVPGISAPLLLAWGDQDQHIPLAQRTQFADLLRQAGKEFVECTFSAGGHGFFCEERASYAPRAARPAWALLKEFLRPEGGE